MKTRLSRHILLTILVFSILLISIVAIHAQQTPTPTLAPTVTPTPNPREVLISEIKNLAQRHVDNDAGLKTELAIELYKNNTVGLTSSEIAKVYDEEYTRLKKAKKPTPWEQFRPNMGWAVAAILFILFILRDILKESLSKLFKAIWEKIYKKFAGRQWLRGKALARYRKALFDKYAKLVIPFRPNRPLDMHEVYVPLKVTGGKESEQIEAQTAITQHRRLMVVGQPGSGKSMLCKNLAFAYSENRLDLPDVPIPILLELHRLNDAKLSIEEQLAKEFERNDFPHAEHFVSQSLKNGTLMLLLDGLDEVSSNEREGVVRAIKDLLDKHRNCRVLITCRTAVYNNDFADAVDQTLEIVDFSDQQIRQFLRSWEKDMPAEKSIEQLMHTLRDRPRILVLARNPLLLTIIAYLYIDTPYVLPHSRAEFYRKATDQLLNEWHTERNRFEFRDKKAILQHLALFNQDAGAQRQEDRRSIEYRTVVEQIRQILPQVNLKTEQVDEVLNEIVERSGLLLSIDGGERYQFAHLTLQEFLAAEELLSDTQGLIDRFSQDHDAWRETVKLWCGLASDSTSLIRTIYNEDSITAFECLADAKKIEPSLTDKIIDYFKDQFSQIGERLWAGLAIAGLGRAGVMRSRVTEINYEGDAIIRAFGAVASDLRPRGKAVFKFLQDTIETSIQKEQFLAAAYALSFTNLLQAAEVAKYYTDKPEVREALVRMGDIGVPMLKPLVEKGSADTMDDLQAIGTPQAAEVLVPLLWDDEQNTAYKASWRLAALLPQPNVENVLRNYQLTDDQRKAEWLDWIWKPFNEPANSALPVIAGRIAYLMKQAPIATVPQKPLHLDLRLSIPLYFVINKDNDKNKELLNTILSKIQNKLKNIEDKRKPDQNDWINVFHPVIFDFQSSWHNRTLSTLVTTMVLIALRSIVGTIWNSPVLITWLNGFRVVIAAFILMLNLLGAFWWIAGDKEANIGACSILFWQPSLYYIRIWQKRRNGVDWAHFVTAFILFGWWLPSITYFTIKFMLKFLPVQFGVPIGLSLSIGCMLLFWSVRRRYHLAQNPLYGILEPPSSKVVSVPSFFSKWFRPLSKRKGR